MLQHIAQYLKMIDMQLKQEQDQIHIKIIIIHQCINIKMNTLMVLKLKEEEDQILRKRSIIYQHIQMKMNMFMFLKLKQEEQQIQLIHHYMHQHILNMQIIMMMHMDIEE